MKILISLFIIALCSNIFGFNNILKDTNLRVPKIDFNPKTYICHKTEKKIIIDGVSKDSAWNDANFTDYFVDIEGSLKPKPNLKTRVKMLWDENYFYFYAEMEEPNLIAELKKRDSIIYYDNDFEIFIDPEGDTHKYYELEINALNTLWDLMLTKPYRDGGKAIDGWDVREIKKAVYLNGTLNNPNDKDIGWSVEMAIPWNIREDSFTFQNKPKSGDIWKINFSRVQWDYKVENNKYSKIKGHPEHNWVWSPQGLIDMHYPEMWGKVLFTNSSNNPIIPQTEEDKIHFALRELYYLEKDYYDKNKKYTDDLTELKFQNIGIKNFNPKIRCLKNYYEISVKNSDGKIITIRNDGKIWRE